MPPPTTTRCCVAAARCGPAFRAGAPVVSVVGVSLVMTGTLGTRGFAGGRLLFRRRNGFLTSAGAPV
ncbi:hypothetical protein GCM10027194_18380 [Thalassiella azotivora]